MELVMLKFLKSLPHTLMPKPPVRVACDILLIHIRTILCDRVLSKELRLVLVEVIGPLAKVSSGVCNVHDLEALLQPAMERLNMKSCCTVEEEVKTLADLVALVHQMNTAVDALLTPPLTPNDEEDDDDVFIHNEGFMRPLTPIAERITYSRSEIVALRFHKLRRIKLTAMAHCLGIVRDSEMTTYKRSGLRSISLSSAESEESTFERDKNSLGSSRGQQSREDAVSRWEHDLFNPNY